jgi:hypothetical protein
MKKIRVLIMLLVVLLIPCLIFAACNDNSDSEKEDCSEGHTWKNGNNPKRQKLIQNRTCTLPEVRERECKVCGHTEQYESLEPLGHSYDTSKKIYLNDATCTENGHTVNHCYWYERCGYEADLIEEVPGSATGHTFLYYVPSAEDPTIGVAKCTDCDATDIQLLGIKLDMEGDRSHLSYQAMQIYTANAANASEYKTVGDNTYLSISRPATGYLGGTEFGISVAPHKNITKDTYVIEFTLVLDEANSGDVSVIAKKDRLNQTMEFVKYNSVDKNIEGVNGAVYGVTADDFANGLDIAVVVNNSAQWYQIYANDTLVSDSIAFNADFFVGFDLATIDIVMGGVDASVFGVDNISIYVGTEPDGYEDAVDQSYITVNVGDGEKVSIKKPAEGCEHAYAVKKIVEKTCTTAGYVIQECSKCFGQNVTAIEEAEGHTYDMQNATIVPPTCLEPGYKVYTCTECGAKSGEQDKPAKGHTHGADVVIIPANCKSNALKKGNCVDCGTYFEESVSGTKLEHALGENKIVVRPTCSTDGYTHGNCIHCGQDFTDPATIVKAFGHYYFDLDEHVEANCAQGGYDQFTCLSCKKKIKINEVQTTGHKTYVNIESKGGKTTVYTNCINCSYSNAYTAASPDTPVPEFADMQTALGSALLDRAYAIGDTSKKTMGAGGTHDTVSGTFKNIGWYNKIDEEGNFGRIEMAATGHDGYQDFAYKSSGLYGENKKPVVFEIEVKWPTQQELAEMGTGYVTGGLILGFRSLDSVICIDPKGGGIYATNPNRPDAEKYQTKMHTKIGQIEDDAWNKIAIAIDFVAQEYDLYVNGAHMITIGFHAAFKAATGTNCMRIGVNEYRNPDGIGVIDLRNIYVYQSDTPVYKGAPPVPAEVLAADFAKDSSGMPFESALDYPVDLYGTLELDVKQNYKLTQEANTLAIQYGSAVDSAPYAAEGFDSSIYTYISDYANKSFTVNTEVYFDQISGNFDIFRLSKTGASESLITFKDGTISVIGSDWTKTVAADDKIKFDAVITGNTCEIYVDGVLVVESLSLGTTYDILNMFAINAESDAVSVVVSYITGYGEAIVPNYYAGRLVYHGLEGFRTELSYFDGTEKLEDALYVNAKRPGGYYYEEIVGQSALSLIVCPETEKVLGNFRFTTVAGDGTLGTPDGFNALVLSDFATYGYIEALFQDNLPGLAMDFEKGYYIGIYDKFVARFYVEDKTAGYEIKISATAAGGNDIVIAEGAFTTGWHVIEAAIPADVDYIYGLCIEFKGVDGNGAVDGFTFALEKIYVESDLQILEDTLFVFSPLTQENCVHTYGEKTTVDATCNANGYTKETCTKCGYLNVTKIDKLTHNFVADADATASFVPETYKPGCERDQYVVGKCTECEAYNLEVKPAIGHNFVLDENATAADGKKAATCLETGIDVYICTNPDCEHTGRKFLMVTDALGHAPAADAETIIKSEASCLVNGVTTISKCANCGEAYDIIVEATGHNYKHIVESANCTENGREYDKCEGCGDVKNNAVIKATGHSAPAIYLHTRVDTTCTHAKGWKYTCTDCGEIGYIADPGEVARPHTWSDWNVETPATCGTDGFRDKVCAECEKKLSEIGTAAEKADCVIPATGEHVWNTEWTYTDDFVAGLRGEKWHDCAVCDEIKDFNGAGSEGLVFANNNKNAYVVTGYTGTDKNVIIPAIFKGKPVILGAALAGNTEITSVTIADGVLIDSGAFAGCTSLESVKLPADLTAVPADAFNGCTSLKTIELPATCTEIRMGAFFGCSALTKITIKGELTSVQQFAFAGCDNLATVEYITTVIPYINIANIGNDAFKNASWVVAE